MLRRPRRSAATSSIEVSEGTTPTGASKRSSACVTLRVCVRPCLAETISSTRPQWFPHKEGRHAKIQLMTIWWGANDAALPGQAQHVPLERFRSNIREMVSLMRDPASPYHSPETSIILINSPTFYPELWLDERAKRGLPREHDRDLTVTRRYADEVKSLGLELGVPVADADAVIAQEIKQVGEENPEAIWSDGLHLTQRSYAVVTQGEASVSPP